MKELEVHHRAQDLSHGGLSRCNADKDDGGGGDVDNDDSDGEGSSDRGDFLSTGIWGQMVWGAVQAAVLIEPPAQDFNVQPRWTATTQTSNPQTL